MKYFWYKPTQTEYEWTKFGNETTMRTNRLDTLAKSKTLRTVRNKGPPVNLFFSQKAPFILLLIIMPLLGEQSHSNKHSYSVSVIALLELMYIEINRCSSSFYCSHVAPLKKVAFVSVSKILCPWDCSSFERMKCLSRLLWSSF